MCVCVCLIYIILMKPVSLPTVVPCSLSLTHKRKEAMESLPDTVWTMSQNWATVLIVSLRFKQESRQLYKVNMFQRFVVHDCGHS